MAITKKPRRTRVTTRLDAWLYDLAKAEAKRLRVAVRAIIDAALANRYNPEHERREQSEVLKEICTPRQRIRELEFGNGEAGSLRTSDSEHVWHRQLQL